ncbi:MULTISPECIES: S8 family peptidase [Niastella]|uniref:S8 family peptidase n=1 Tax=Niastella soli TaxID=2821487 RepID=A0ABS3YTY5_9BACT|nr:S8 family peptidase [Niastella soli]MBO9201345.1 S8 family peptidase [Niastella soli]
MKRIGLLLLILIITVPMVQAQQRITIYNHKLSPVLQKNKNLFSEKKEQVFWIVTSNVDSAKTYFRTKQVAIRILQEHAGGLLVVSAKGPIIDSLVLNQPFVRFVDVPRQPHEELAVGTFDNSLNTINLVHSKYAQLTGTNLVVSVKENKPDTTDIDYKARYISTPLSSNLISSHASYMCTIIAGGENSFYTGSGVAPAASLTSSNFATLLPDGENIYKQYGISVQNHSYGTGLENYYGADAAAYDASIINNPGLLHVFSSGNSGNLTSTGPYAGINNMSNLTGSFKMAKNIITVGATDSFGNVAYLSSRGPAYDGRLKPELIAFGEDGTSGAAAHTSGTVLLLQQYYKEKHGGTLPPSSLIKTILVNSADDRGTKGPDYQAGYGSLNAYKALQGLIAEQYFSGSVATNTTQTFSLPVPANTRQLKVTLCWMDPAAVVNTPKALVNDLDLELVENNTGKTWQPWVLSPAPIIDSLLLPAVRKKDTLNTVEQITIDNPSPGGYTIRVKGFSVTAGGNQSFSIAWLADAADQFQWQFPTAVDYVKSGENNLLRWSSSFNTTNGSLEYSLNKGLTWQTMENTTTLSPGHTYWQAPDTCSTALLRMTVNGQVFTTDTFTISPVLQVKVGFNCPDSAMLFWDHIPGINTYRVYRLGSKYLEPLTTLTDTSIIIRQPGNNLWYTVAPVITPTREGTKAYTINYQLQGVDCYIKNFLVELENGNTGMLMAEIGTTLNVKSLTFEKLTSGGYEPLQTFQPVSSLFFNMADNNLVDGVNTYRVKLLLNNGMVIYSNPQSIYYFITTRYLIFPNPVKVTGYLSVLSKEEPENSYLLLYNTLGQQVLQYRLQQTVEMVPLSGLKSGIYFVMIKKNGKKDFTTKVMVQ